METLFNNKPDPGYEDEIKKENRICKTVHAQQRW
jgi:hypothetical protein